MYRLYARLVCSVVLMACSAVARAQAQDSLRTADSLRTSGIAFGFGLGYGTALVTCDLCDQDHRRGFTGLLRVAGGLNRQVRIGVEVNAWRNPPEWIGSASLVVYDHPEPQLGFYFDVGLGLAQYHVKTSDFTATNGLGPGLVGGLGYEAPVGKRTFVVPAANFHYGFVGQVGGAYQRKEWVADIGIGLLFRH